MKYIMLVFLAFQLFAQEDTTISEEIQKTKNIDELNTQMQNAPRQYRHRYIQAIKERARAENEAKREQLLSHLNAEKAEDIGMQQINALTGRNNKDNSSTGTGNGNGNGNGGGGGGKGGR